MEKTRKRTDRNASEGADGKGLKRLFDRFATRVAHAAGRPMTFLAAALFILVWALSGPLFGFSDTWQLMVNTTTTIITFLMVFLIQHTQNRDGLAVQIKLAELILVMKGAKNALATAEDHSEDYLEHLHEAYRRLGNGDGDRENSNGGSRKRPRRSRSKSGSRTTGHAT